MAQLWGGRFAKETDKRVFDFNASIDFDCLLLPVDIEGSRAHAEMLAEVGVITETERDEILGGLSSIVDDVSEGRLDITDEYEDVHSFVEANLIKRIGDTGKKLHTGRSRNDQVALDMKLYTRNRAIKTHGLLYDLLETILGIMKDHKDSILPGFTHLQKAQPVTLAHHMGAYFEMFSRDRDRIGDTVRRMNFNPLGSGALAGTTYPLDRMITTKRLGFDSPTFNSMDGVSDRDYLIEYLADLALIMMHLSRFCEEIIIWNSDEYRFVELDDAFSTGSSIMPQKKNPDIAELIRGKTGRVYGELMALLTTMKSLPLAYNKDMQEDKELPFDAMDTTESCLSLFTGMLSTMSFNTDRMEKSAAGGFSNATDVADYLVTKGVAFRDAHGIIGKMVLYCIDNKKAIDELSLDEFKSFSESFEQDVYDSISMKACVDRRQTIGAPGAMEEAIKFYEYYLAQSGPDAAVKNVEE